MKLNQAQVLSGFLSNATGGTVILAYDADHAKALVRITGWHQTAGAGNITVNGTVLGIPAAIALGTPIDISFGDGLKITQDVTVNGACGLTGTLEYIQVT